jgi:small-conductance mechanosensitive channel
MDGLQHGSLSVLWSGVVLTAAALSGLAVHAILFWVARRAVRRTDNVLDDALVRRASTPLRLLLPLFAVIAVFDSMPPPDRIQSVADHALSLVMVAGIAWLLVSLTRVVDDVVEARFPLDVADNLESRRVVTLARFFRRFVTTIILVVATAIMLMTFSAIRHLGTSILASAGIAGLIAGIAARPVLSNLLAGVQIALTGPIHIDDVVVVEGEWGRIEEISRTYVVVRIWDLRRLILPLTYFIEKPFQNWTRVTADILGTVYVHADYRLPVDEVRDELHHILEGSGLWDGKVWNLQVTGVSETTLELRALMSAPDSGKAWELRCLVRERLMNYLQREHPDKLPRVRADVRQPAGGNGLEAPSAA